MASKRNTESGAAVDRAAHGSAPWRYYVLDRDDRHIVSQHRTLHGAQVSLNRKRQRTSGNYILAEAPNAKVCPHCRGTGSVPNDAGER